MFYGVGVRIVAVRDSRGRGSTFYGRILEDAEDANAATSRQAAATLDILFSGLVSASTTLLETAADGALRNGGR